MQILHIVLGERVYIIQKWGTPKTGEIRIFERENMVYINV
jgi:hypothetical protein